MTNESTQKALAAVFTGPGRPLSFEQLALPRLAPGEVLVQMRACTLCGSDLHTYVGDRETPTPTILGHEILGEIAAIGDGRAPLDHAGNALGIGDRITWSIAASCGACFFCRHEIPQKCEHLFKYGHEAMEPPHLLSGGLAEYCQLAPGTAMVRIPETVPDRVACPVNCATATVAAAVRVGLAGHEADSVLVQGVGMLGLTACAMLRSRGARMVIAADKDQSRLALAKKFGADHLIEVGAQATSEVVADLTGGRGVDLALEMSGAPAAVAGGLSVLRIGGRQVLVGTVFPTDPVSIQPEALVRNLLSVHGVHNYTPVDLAAAVAFLEEHHDTFPFESLVEGAYPLPEAERAFEDALQSRAPRILVTARQ